MAINALQAALLGLFACLASLPGMGGTTIGNYTLGRPLVGGLVVGLILGDVQSGIIVGAAIQVVYIALVTPGGTVSADVRAVTYIGIPLSILAIHAQGLDPSSAAAASLAAALGAAVGTLGTVLFYGTATLNLVWQSIGWKAMETRDWNTIKRQIPLVDFVYPWISHVLFSFIPTFIICMAGSQMVQLMKDYMPMDGLAMKTLFTVGSLLPAVGIAILCKQVINKPLDWLTFAFGFTLAACLHLNLIACAVVAAFFALIKYQIEEAKVARPAISGGAGASDDEEEEDI
ncbi:PTS sugar transporter subunit IIC [Olsenella sp. HMSC062G07]|uniref:PTS mannose/fructose/sorbose/N-acetylgalactosamine transporter subunit IIC n=1 Tax=Olsenella sp. HMSC062G07 TaxID=1739330 RepID=UPI0008A45CF5|nr:PTS sugar transporter subunit IIC [Olsenella sp. HMSC062G07]OFK23680.1 PTS sorbose transporter subunit IIC [Olsenella sp. HMSC062G07]